MLHDILIFHLFFTCILTDGENQVHWHIDLLINSWKGLTVVRFIVRNISDVCRYCFNAAGVIHPIHPKHVELPCC